MTDLQKLEAVKENYARFIQTEQRLFEQRAKAERTTRPLQEIHYNSHAENWREDAIIQMAEARDELADVLNEYIDSWQAAHAVLDGITDPRHYEVLFRRYIQGYSWRKIAAEMGCSERQCVNLHNGVKKYLLQCKW